MKALAFAATIYACAWFVLRHGTMLSPRLASFPRWPVLFDLLLTVPAATWWLYRRDRHRAWRRALSLAGLGVLVSINLLPDISATGTTDLHGLRTLLLAAGAVVELLLMIRLWRFVSAAAQQHNPEYALQRLIAKRFGTKTLGRAVGFESRLWLHSLAPPSWSCWQYRGERHFSYHLKDGYAANLQGLVVLLLIGIPAQHLLLGLLSSSLAWVTDIMTVYALLFLLAHYRACLRCPISLDGSALYLRHGIGVREQVIPLASIAGFESCREMPVRPTAGVLSLAGAGRPNVRLRLRQSRAIEGVYGMMRPVHTIYLGLDQAPRFLAAMEASRDQGQVETARPSEGS
ncbi:MAG: hypothetical protein WC617_16835 [Rhodanobacter sp.]|jgi:hypothetical protein